MISQSRFLLFAAVLPLATLTILSACQPQQGGSGAGAPTSTEWKEGYGGDSIALEAVQLIQQTCNLTKRLRAPLLKSALETDVEVGAAICGLLEPGALVVESVKQPTVGGLEKDAANFPDQMPKRLQIKATFWRDASMTSEKREEMLVHELLPLVRIEDMGYIRSARLLVALNAARGFVQEVSCESRSIEALLSGTTGTGARFLGRELGLQHCSVALEIVSSYRPASSKDEAIKMEVAQALALGAFVGAAQTSEPHSIEKFEDFFVSTIEALPVALAIWSPGMCAQDADPSANDNLCAGLLSFIFGATPEQKGYIVTGAGSSTDFDRATMSFLNRMIRSPKLLPSFMINGRVDQDLVKAAVRSQNWNPLAVLGQVHRSLGLAGTASEILTQGFDWSKLTNAGSRVPPWIHSQLSGANLMNCSNAEIRGHVTLILEGGTRTLRCAMVYAI